MFFLTDHGSIKGQENLTVYKGVFVCFLFNVNYLNYYLISLSSFKEPTDFPLKVQKTKKNKPFSLYLGFPTPLKQHCPLHQATQFWSCTVFYLIDRWISKAHAESEGRIKLIWPSPQQLVKQCWNKCNLCGDRLQPRC